MLLQENNLSPRASVIWLSGLPCSGKTTIATGIVKLLQSQGIATRLLDGDLIRKGICSDLGYSEKDRIENIRRIAEISKLFVETGIVTVCAFITPTERLRNLARGIVGSGQFTSVFVNAPLNVCEQRDVKGMYRKARLGEIAEFTGVSAPFEPPMDADIELDTSSGDEAGSVKQLFDFVIQKLKSNS